MCLMKLGGDLMRKKRFVSIILFFVFILFFSIGNTVSIYGVEDKRNVKVESSSNSEEVEVVESEVDWLANFQEITEVELNKIIDSYVIKSATLNSNSSNLYFVLEDSEGNIVKYKVINSSPYLFSYLKTNGIEYKTLIFDESIIDIEQSQKELQNQKWLRIGLFGGLALLLFIIPIYLYNKKQKSAIPIATNSGSGSQKTNEEIPKVRFDDVEGIEELKADIMRLVDCLKSPKKYQAIGARPPKGVILYGPPGTGKTLIAKAIAGEAGVPFFSMVGSDFVEKYVGVGAQRVRDLYKKARKAAPCIVFIDEVDAVAGQRGRDENTESDQTINALLAELDGFKGTENIITICATNRLDMLDSAFKRAGRFDLKLAVGLPDKKGRKNILAIHSKNKKLHSEVDLEVLANKTVGFSGAELETLLNEAALVAVGKNKKEIDYEDIDDAFFKLVMQGNKKKREKITEVNKVVAWHEAGHTLATKLLTDDGVPSVTIVGSSSGAGGVTFRTPQEDNILHSKKYLESLIQIMYAGRAAEELYFGDEDSITTGASQDIKQASGIIKEYLSIYGMGKLGMLDLTQFRHDYEDIMDEATDMAQSLYGSVLNLLKENYDLLKDLSENLLDKETLDESQIDEIIQKYQ